MDSIDFKLTYSALKLFGRQLYSNPNSAISELVANGIDAGASNVFISINLINKQNGFVEIFDDGCGMSRCDIEKNYIKIGYNKRNEKNIKKDTMLGRKGIGKLAALYLSDKFTIVTKKKDSKNEIMCWELDVSSMDDDAIPKLIEKDVNLVSSDLTCIEKIKQSDSGTLVFLENVDFNKMGDKAFESLQNKLSNYYLYDEMSTEIKINIFKNKDDKGKFKKIEKHIAFKNMICLYTDDAEKFKYLESSYFKYKFKDKLGRLNEYREKTEVINFSEIVKSVGRISDKNIPYKLKGWIGIHCTIDTNDALENDPIYIKNQFYNPNQIRVYIKKKLAMDNMINHLGITRAFANYIEGEISFDVLDSDDLTDKTTANRQDFDVTDERFVLLNDMITKIGNKLVEKRQKLSKNVDNEQNIKNLEISSTSKNIFAKEIHDEFKLLNVNDTNSKFNLASLESVIINKIEGNTSISIKNKFTVFISHSKKDLIISDFIFNYLVKLGFKGDLSSEDCEIFYSTSGLDSNNLKPLSILIKDAIISKNNDILFITSKNFNDSQYCLFEGGAAWATRSIDEYKVLSFNYEDIPNFLSNGKAEFCLGINKKEDFILDKIKYNNFVNIFNRLIEHLNKNRKLRNAPLIELMSIINFPDAVELKKNNKKDSDYMDKIFVSYWETYVTSKSENYIKENDF